MIDKIQILKQAREVIDGLIQNGPRWKPKKDVQHLAKRKRREHIPVDWSVEDYNNLILTIVKELDNEAFLYVKECFDQRYFAFGDQHWVVIVGEDGIIETAFPPDDYMDYLSLEEGYVYLGTIKEVRENGI